MIFIELAGRLGNQLFRYAIARKFDIERGANEKILLGISSYKHAQYKKDNFNQLKDFHVKANAETIKWMMQCLAPIDAMMYRLLFLIKKIGRYNDSEFERKYWKIFNKIGIVLGHYGNYKFFNSGLRNMFFDGDFQNPKYFDSIRDTLLEEFTPKHKPLAENSKLYSIIKNDNSICVHIRRGDYLSETYKKDFYVCDENYYIKAIKIMQKRIENPVFFFFSNDIDWVKENIKVSSPCYYEPKNNPLWESFRMMYCCKHFIISNSTMSWWGQYLGTYSDKVVISPDHWFNNPEKEGEVNLIQPEFIKVVCNYH